jgi:hypothetical protein
VQDLRIEAHNTRYRRTVYRLPDDSSRVAVLPPEVTGHFGVGLRQFMLYQVHHTHVSQARLLEQLHEYGIDISAGQVNEILLQGHDALHAEKDALLPTAREICGACTPMTPQLGTTARMRSARTSATNCLPLSIPPTASRV